jgi:lysyl-tRNA synthetase, class II
MCLAITGRPHRTKTGQLSVAATELPKVLTPVVHITPPELESKHLRMQDRHLDLIVNRKSAEMLRLRSHIVQYLRTFFLNDGFLEVQTPILQEGAGGAIARPFQTRATEFSDRHISLRIAPELWLKRLVIGGFDRVFEIGQSFRNEGIDATHNPEFTTCEFYKAFTDLEELVDMTETLFTGLANRIVGLKQSQFPTLKPLTEVNFATPFKRLDFVPALEAAMDTELPDLSADDAADKLLFLMTMLEVDPPSSKTLPRLLDKLSTVYLEPLCTQPTFIMNHPECLSPLAKSSLVNGQRISHRVELFIQGREYVNAYEEENSPLEQRRKFEQQLSFRDGDENVALDESYIKALEWGLAPTGGWGLGVDRLCMLFTGASRIEDVLTFGSLRHVLKEKEVGETVVYKPLIKGLGS